MDAAAAGLIGAVTGAVTAGSVGILTEVVRNRHAARMSALDRDAGRRALTEQRRYEAYMSTARALGRVRRLTFDAAAGGRQLHELWQDLAIDLSALFVVATDENVRKAASQFVGRTEDILARDFSTAGSSDDAGRKKLLDDQLNAIIGLEAAMREDMAAW